MAERLTKEDYYTWDEDGTKKLSYIQKLQNKLGKLEDILEKYGIESLDILEQELKIAYEIERLKDKKVDLNNAIIVFNKDFIKDYIREIEELKTDRDTWKRACELMGEELDMYATKEDNTISTAQYFYQQAKKEGNDDK